MVRTYGGHHGASSLGGVFTQNFQLAPTTTKAPAPQPPQPLLQPPPKPPESNYSKEQFTTPSPDFSIVSPVAGQRPVTRASHVPLCNGLTNSCNHCKQNQLNGGQNRPPLTPVPGAQTSQANVPNMNATNHLFRPHSRHPPFHHSGPTWAGRDAMGNIFILPRQLEVGLCQNCKRLFGVGSNQHSSVTTPQIPPPGPKPIDYDALLNKKRTEENNYRHSADLFVIPGNGPQASGNDPFMTRINEPPSSMLYDDYGLGNELRDLSGVLSRLQQNLTDSDDSGMGSLKIESYPQSTLQSASQVRKSWSAPTPGPDSAGQPTQDWLQDYNYAATGNQLADPLQHLRQKNDAPSSGTTYNPSVYGSGGKRGGNDRESYLRELEIQIAEQKARKEKENQGNQDWWEKPKDPQFQVNPPMRPHPSQTADQLPDPKDARKRYENELRQQMELKKQRENEEKQKILEEELKLERRIQEQQERMRLEFEEEQAKKRAKEDAKNKRQEQLAKRQEEIQREVEQKKKLEAEKRMQERRAAAREAENQRPADNNSDISRGSSPALTRRSDSPPLPTLLKKGSSVGGSSDGTRSVSSASVGGLSSGTDDEQGEVLNQLNTMKKQLDKLEVSPRDQKKRRQSQVWEGLAEV